MKKILIALFILLLIAAAAAFAFFKGVEKVRDGLVANYPTVKNLVQGAVFEIDSVVSFTFSKTENPELFQALNTDVKSDSLLVSVPYYGRYGIDLSSRNFRLFRDGQTVDVALPPIRLLYCEMKFDRLSLNGKPAYAVRKNETAAAHNQQLFQALVTKLEKNKDAQKQAKTQIAKALMFYFIPYKFDLHLYINEQLQTLPTVPGLNQSVDDAIKQMLGK